MQNLPYLHYPHYQRQPLPGEMFPGIFPWDPLRLRIGQQVLIYPFRKLEFQAEILTATFYPNLSEIPDFAFLWVTNHPRPIQSRRQFHDAYTGQYNLHRTPFGLYTFQREMYHPLHS